MEITIREMVTTVHGMLFGGFFLIGIFGMLVELCRSSQSLEESRLTPRGRSMERGYLIVLVLLGWTAVLSGAYIVYPWYRATPPAGVTDLSLYPQRFLMASARTSRWHTLGMEWKEHVAWLAPIAITMAAYVLTKYRGSMKEQSQVRAAVLTFALIAFLAAGIAGTFGAMINQHAPTHGGDAIHLEGESK